MQRLNHNIANREAGTRIHRILGMVNEAVTFPLVLRFYLRRFVISRHAKVLVEQLTAGVFVMASALCWRGSCQLCPVRVRQEQARFRSTPVGKSGFGRRG